MKDIMFSKVVFTAIVCVCSFIILLGDPVSGNCSDETERNCTVGPLQVLQDWLQNPGTSSADLNKICKANNDLWNCLVNNNCDVSSIKSTYESTRSKCGGVSIRQGTFLTVTLSLFTFIIKSLFLY